MQRKREKYVEDKAIVSQGCSSSIRTNASRHPEVCSVCEKIYVEKQSELNFVVERNLKESILVAHINNPYLVPLPQTLAFGKFGDDLMLTKIKNVWEGLKDRPVACRKEDIPRARILISALLKR